MNKKLIAAALAGGVALVAGPAQAMLVADIDFSEVADETLDPVIEGFSFSANDPAEWADTITGEFITPGDPYLASGFDDLDTNFIPAGGGKLNFQVGLINVALDSIIGGAKEDTTISLDVASFAPLPSGTTISMAVLLGGLVQQVVSITTDNSSYQLLEVTLDGDRFNGLRIWDDQTFGDGFRIDNLRVDVTEDPTNAPLPGTVALLGLGLLGMGLGRKATTD